VIFCVDNAGVIYTKHLDARYTFGARYLSKNTVLNCRLPSVLCLYSSEIRIRQTFDPVRWNLSIGNIQISVYELWLNDDGTGDTSTILGYKLTRCHFVILIMLHTLRFSLQNAVYFIMLHFWFLYYLHFTYRVC
jgi:hypothetical protein